MFLTPHLQCQTLILMHSTELDKSYESFMASTRLNNAVNSTKSYSQSPRASYHPLPQTTTGNGTGTKLPPTGPRAYKKPRLSEAHASPPLRTNTALPPHKSHSKPHPPARGHDTRDYARRLPEGRGKLNHVKMDIEEDSRAIPPSPAYDRERERDHDRERERGSKERERGSRERERGSRERDRDGGRERDGNRHPRRNSGFVGRGGGGGPARRAERVLAPIDTFPGGDRTLAERMGL